MSAAMILQLEHLEVWYDEVILGVRDISLVVPRGGIVALLGANGAGKSTTLKAISRLVGAQRGDVRRGQVTYDGSDITGADPADLVRRGLAQVLEGRHCFGSLSVEENLKIGGFVRRPSRSALRLGLEKIYHYFPRLKQCRHATAGYASGGEQQMIAIGRALMSAPSLLLLDEPSMGLAPQMVEEIFTIMAALNRTEKLSFLLAEQNATMALRYASYAYLLENGRVASSGSMAELESGGHVQAGYLGAVH